MGIISNRARSGQRVPVRAPWAEADSIRVSAPPPGETPRDAMASGLPVPGGAAWWLGIADPAAAYAGFFLLGVAAGDTRPRVLAAAKAPPVVGGLDPPGVLLRTPPLLPMFGTVPGGRDDHSARDDPSDSRAAGLECMGPPARAPPIAPARLFPQICLDLRPGRPVSALQESRGTTSTSMLSGVTRRVRPLGRMRLDPRLQCSIERLHRPDRLPRSTELGSVLPQFSLSAILPVRPTHVVVPRDFHLSSRATPRECAPVPHTAQEMCFPKKPSCSPRPPSGPLPSDSRHRAHPALVKPRNG
jgi:hypothetical protein